MCTRFMQLTSDVASSSGALGGGGDEADDAAAMGYGYAHAQAATAVSHLVVPLVPHHATGKPRYSLARY